MGLPRIRGGRRGRILGRLVANGIAQAGLAFALAWLLRGALGAAGEGGVDPRLIAALAAASVGAVALRVAEAAEAERLGQEYVTRVRLRIFRRVAARPEQRDGPARYGLTMTRLISDLGSLKNWVSLGVARSLVASITTVGLLAALAHLDPAFGAAGLGAAGLAAVGAAVLTPALRDRVREARRRRGRLANNLGEKIFAFRTVRHFGRTDRELRRVRGQSRRLRDALVSRIRIAQALRSLPDLALPLGAGTVVWSATAGARTLADGAAAMLLFGLLVAALRDLVRAWDYRLSFEEGRRRIETLLAGPRLPERRGARALDGEGPIGVALRGVRVGDALRDVSFEVAPGERVWIAGPSGSGKSLVLALAARLLDPDAGDVLLDGRPAKSLTLDSIHDAVKLASPEVPLLRGTLGENLRYGAAPEDGVEDALLDAAELCGLGDEPVALPDGLESRIEEQGRNLPPGLRARVGLARALAARPRLLLVDDPAFAVDDTARTVLARVLEELEATVLVAAPEGARPIPAARVWTFGAAAATPRAERRARAGSPR